MRKNGFTLAEILVVLTVIGILAVMTIPSLVQNANSQHKIAMFKKGFNAVSNAYATEFATKTPPKGTAGRLEFFYALANQLNVKYYVHDGEKLFEKPEITTSNDVPQYSIYVEDGMSYSISHSVGGTPCATKLDINSVKSDFKSAASVTCMFAVVDIDGFDKGLNTYCADDADLNKLNCDRIRLYVAKDGITTGNSDCIIAGRIMSDNITYDSSKCSEETP